MQQFNKSTVVGKMQGFSCQTKHIYTVPEIKRIKTLFLEGKTTEEITKLIRLHNSQSVARLISRLIKKEELVLEIDLKFINTETLNSILNQFKTPYKITKSFGKGWVICNNNIVIQELSSHPYTAYKKLQEFLIYHV
jgi:hypothetical protein